MSTRLEFPTSDSEDEQIDYVLPGKGYKVVLVNIPQYLFVKCALTDSHSDVCLVDNEIDPLTLTPPDITKMEGVEQLCQLRDGVEAVDAAELGAPIPEEYVILSHFQVSLHR